MPFGLCPGGSPVGMLAGRVWKSDADAGTTVAEQRRRYAIDYGIMVLQGSGNNVDRITVGLELRGNDAIDL